MAEHEHTTHPRKAASGGLGKKMGPLPVWAWGLIIGVGVYFLYTRYNSASNTSATAASSSLDPNAIDPNTGLTYGQEEQAAQQNLAPTAGNLGSSGGGGTTTGTETGADSFDTNLTNLEGLLGFIQSVDPNFGTGAGAAGGSGANGGGDGTNSGTGTNSPPLTGSTPPPTTPTAHKQIPSPITTAKGTVGLGHTEGKLPTTATSKAALNKAIKAASKPLKGPGAALKPPPKPKPPKKTPKPTTRRGP